MGERSAGPRALDGHPAAVPLGERTAAARHAYWITAGLAAGGAAVLHAYWIPQPASQPASRTGALPAFRTGAQPRREPEPGPPRLRATQPASRPGAQPGPADGDAARRKGAVGVG